ncbi:cell division protein FtsH, partial [Saccharothrix sp. MB29]|nr:cell division protein FtsH [Saccharothrix sp. MB29]
KITAYHEAGHALAAWAMPDIDPVYKVTILARGRTGGHTLSVPEEDKDLMTRSEMIARLVFALGGRSAEELVFHEPTTGASNDIEQATKIARAMVTEYGMSARLGAVKYGQEQGEPFLGRTAGRQADYSLEVAHEIDEEVRELIEAAHTEAYEVLNTYRDVLDALTLELIEKETLHQKDLERIFASVEKRPRITKFNEFGTRTPSDKPPVKTPAELAKERGEPWPPAIEDLRDAEPSVPDPTPAPPVNPTGPNAPVVPAGQTAPIPTSPNGSNGSPYPAPAAPGQQHQPPQHPSSGPPNYGAPPGWTPATAPGGNVAQPPWQPGPTDAEAGKRNFDSDPDNRT